MRIFFSILENLEEDEFYLRGKASLRNLEFRTSEFLFLWKNSLTHLT